MSHSKHTFKNQKSTKAPDMPNLNARFLSISLSKDDQDWQSVLHTHHFTEIFYVLNGEGNFLFRDVKRPIKTGDLVIVPPYVEHTEQSIPGKSLKYYIKRAGGFADRAHKSHVYAIYMNGSVKELGRRTGKGDIQPGCEIMVPSKPQRNKMTPQEIMTIGTSTASLATVIATLVNILK